MERSAASTEGDQVEKMSSPSEKDFPPVSADTSAPLNFSDLRPCQFGISVQSFTPAPISNRKDTSRLAQLKARRRSNVGVRGSPETNSLIRFMAQKKMKTPPSLQTPELDRSSPFFPRVPSTLRQKMASFQDLMDVEESEVCDATLMQDSSTGGRIKTRDYLSDRNSHDGDKENRSSLMKPTPSKRRRLGPLETCQLEIRETSAPILQFTLKEQEEHKEPVKPVVTQGPLPSRETVEEAQAVLISPPFHSDIKLQACSLFKNQQDSVFELQSPSQPLPDDPPATPPARPASSLHIHSVPSQLEMKPTGENDSAADSTAKNKKKSVRFGCPLSPEFFDKNLPPSTPLQKGGTPARGPTPGGSLQLRSVLKTPQRSESQTPQAHADLSSPTEFSASPTLAIPRTSRVQSEGEDSEETNGKIVFPSLDEIDSVVTCDTESEAKASTTSQTDELTSLPEEKQLEADVEAPAQPRNRRKKRGPECESTSKAPVTSEAPARSRSRKRKLPDENEPVKRPTRSAAKSASGKIKMTSTAKRRWNKDVDRSLYNTRAYASKNPALSPITESLSFIGQSPAAQQSPSASYTAPIQETNLNPEMTNNSQAMSDPTATNTFENPSEDSITSSNSSKESTTRKDRRLSGPKIRRRGLNRRKISVADGILLSEETLDQTEGKMEEHCGKKPTTSLKASRETPLTHTVLEEGGVDSKPNAQTSADTLCPDSYGKLECPDSLDAPMSDSSSTLSLPSEPAQRKAKQGRRSSVNNSILQEQGIQEEDLHTGHEVGEKEQKAQAASQQEPLRSGSDSQEDWAVASLDLAPWQADFNFEDVFKPIPTRGQRSVRRSLRNLCKTDLSSSGGGLAWLPRTSPDYSKEARRRTRGRGLSTAPPVQPLLPEETQDIAS